MYNKTIIKFGFCVAHTKCNLHNAIQDVQDIYSWLCHGEESACHVVLAKLHKLPSFGKRPFCGFKKGIRSFSPQVD